MRVRRSPPFPKKPLLRWRQSWGGGAFSAMAVLLLQAAPAKADIWGYVDADRMPHLTPTQLDERYELLRRDSVAVEPYKRMESSRAAAAASPEPQPTPVTVTVAAGPQATPLSPKQVNFFERSKSYKAVSPLLKEASLKHGIDYSLLKALITAESGFNPDAVSPKGAVGLMQLIPPTAERYGVSSSKGVTIEAKLTDPKVNIRAGARYLADLIKMFPGRLELAIAAYNAGEGAVQRAGNKIPNYPETQNYVKTVMQLYNGLGLTLGKTPKPVVTAPNGRVRVELEPDHPPRPRTLPLAEPIQPPPRPDTAKVEKRT